MRHFGIKFVFVTLALVIAGPALAQDKIAAFYKGKQIVLKIGSPTGGGYDVSGRAVSRHMGKHIPGNPSFLVQNVPGGGSLRLVNQLYNIGEKDGSVLALGSSGMPTTPLLTPEAAHYDPRKFSFIGSPIRVTEVFLVNGTAPVQTIDQTKQIELTVGASSPGSATMDYPLVFNGVFGTKFKIITGYGGASEVGLALERKEVEGLVGMSLSSMYTTRWASLWKSGQVNVMAQFGSKPNPKIPDVPLFFQPQNDEERQILKILYAREEFGQPFFLPPGVPADFVAAFRHAFDSTMKDPEFLADAERVKLDIDPVPGEELQVLVEELMSTSPAVIARLAELMDISRKK